MMYNILTDSPFGEYKVAKLNAYVGGEEITNKSLDSLEKMFNLYIRDQSSLDIYTKIRSELFSELLKQ